MHSAIVLATVVVLGAAATAPKNLVKVNLPAPDNWLTGRRLYGRNIIASYNAKLKAYATAEAWNSFVLARCRDIPECSSTASYQGTNTGIAGGRYWYGEIYRGGPTTAADYERFPDPRFGVAHSQMYTIKV